MNRFERRPLIPGEAEVQYLDGDFRVTRSGKFVCCGVTGEHIPLESLRYWSVDRQEAYANPQAVLQRLGRNGGNQGAAERIAVNKGAHD